MITFNSAEARRLHQNQERTAYWRRWGPHLSERQWGTVREDYSADGDPWIYFPHDDARSRAYRWGEDGLLGISDTHQRLCLSLALWNGKDAILKERLFGLTGHEGNHGEDVKEYYFYLDNTPTHSYMKALYKYPQAAFPYEQLREENRRRSRLEPEYELIDTGIFDGDRYFDVFIEFAKSEPEDIFVRYTIVNRGPESATLHLVPTLWFRNTWSWRAGSPKPWLFDDSMRRSVKAIGAEHHELGARWLYADGNPELRFCDNETNLQLLYGVPNRSEFTKDGLNDCIVLGKHATVNSERTGTKAGAHYSFALGPGETRVVTLRLCPSGDLATPFATADSIIVQREHEADEFYAELTPYPISEDARNVQRQAFAGLLWSKQFYHYFVEDWLYGDPAQPPPPPQRLEGRNRDWTGLYSEDIISMPDTWEYPWFAAWDLAFHVVPLAIVDPEFAKQQLILLTREWYLHPDGQLPAYEWTFSDVNPPVQAWAAYRVFRIEQRMRGEGDYLFLERVFQKLLMNFTWWVNRKDPLGNNVFQGGFLGLDNIGIFDRSEGLPAGGSLTQSDATSWMGVYALNMLAIAIELAPKNRAYEDIALKFFEHFLYIADAMNETRGRKASLWNDEDGFYYDVLAMPDGREIPLRVSSMVGLIPLMAVEVIEDEAIKRLPDFERRMNWFFENRKDLHSNVACFHTEGIENRRLLAIADQDKLVRILEKMLDEERFLSPYGVRSLSKTYEQNPYTIEIDGTTYSIDYEPAESRTGLFGGNSNWRGPVWFPLNYLLIEALQKFHFYYGDGLKLEYPSGSGVFMTLWDISIELGRRLVALCLPDAAGNRPIYGNVDRFQRDPHWRDYIRFYEYFNGDNGYGLGADHQTGWTGLIAKLIQQYGEYPAMGKDPLEGQEHVSPSMQAGRLRTRLSVEQPADAYPWAPHR